MKSPFVIIMVAVTPITPWAQSTTPVTKVAVEIAVSRSDGAGRPEQPWPNVGEFLFKESPTATAAPQRCPGVTDVNGKLVCNMECAPDAGVFRRWLVPPRAPVGGARYTTPALQEISVNGCSVVSSKPAKFTYVDAMVSLRNATIGTPFSVTFARAKTLDEVTAFDPNSIVWTQIDTDQASSAKLTEFRRITADLAVQMRDENKGDLSALLSRYTFVAANAEIKAAVLTSSGGTAAQRILIDSSPKTFYLNVDQYKKLVNSREARGMSEVRAVDDLSKLGRANAVDLGSARIPTLPMSIGKLN